jgi:hypothetical protein
MLVSILGDVCCALTLTEVLRRFAEPATVPHVVFSR